MKTTIPLHLRILDLPDFRDATHDIHFVERWLKTQDPARVQVKA